MNTKGLLFAFTAPWIYGFGNVVIEQKLSHLGNLTLMMVFNATIFTAALIVRQVFYRNDPIYSIPLDWTLTLLVGLGILFGLAEFMYLGAYRLKVSVYTITLLTTLIPVSASLSRLLWVRECPNKYFIGAFVLGAGMMVLTILGEQEQTSTHQPP